MVAINTFLMTRLVDSLSLLVASRYADPVLLRNLAPAVGDVSVTAVSQLGSSETRELAILTASEDPNNPYQTYVHIVTIAIGWTDMSSCTVDLMVLLETVSYRDSDCVVCV